MRLLSSNASHSATSLRDTCRISTPNHAGNEKEERMIAAASHVFAAAGLAKAECLSLGISEDFDESAFFGTSNFLSASTPLSGAACTSRSVAYRPVTPEQMRTAIICARPYTLASSQRMLQLPEQLELTSIITKSKHPLKRIVVGRSITLPLLQVSFNVVESFPYLMLLNRLVVATITIAMIC